MRAPDCLIIERCRDWLVLIGSQSETLASESSVDAIVAVVQRLTQLVGSTSGRCLIAPAATSCFFVRLAGDDLPDLRDRNALTFELESHVPLDAETMVADFRVAPNASGPVGADAPSAAGASGTTVAATKAIAAIAIEFKRWKDLADALEASGIRVVQIVPSAMLAARALTEKTSAAELVELLVVEGDECDAVTVRGDAVASWKHLSMDPQSLHLHHQFDLENVARVIAVGADTDQQSQIRQVYGDALMQVEEQSLASLWQQGSEKSFAKPSAHWFDLRRDQLGPGDPLRPIAGQLRLVTVAAFTLLLAVSLGGWLRSQRIDAAIDRISAQQRQAFEQAFPGTPVPAALVRRVRSEHAKVVASRGASSDLELPQSATEVLREFLAALPDTLRFRITSLKITNGRVDLDFQVRTAVDAGTLAIALESHGFEVEPPVTTRKDERTFDSVLEAKWSNGNRLPRGAPALPSEDSALTSEDSAPAGDDSAPRVEAQAPRGEAREAGSKRTLPAVPDSEGQTDAGASASQEAKS